MSYRKTIIQHYNEVWGVPMLMENFKRGPYTELPQDFCLLESPPSKNRKMWTYATCCMSQPDDDDRVELHLFSPRKSTSLAELMTTVAHFHRTGHKLTLGHTVNFGRGWLPGSICDHGLISLPYLDGPRLEKTDSQGTINFYWLIPVTKAEVEYKKKNGLECLENLFERDNFDYLNPERQSVI